MRSRAFAIRDRVWLRIEISPNGTLPPKEACFDTIEVAEEFARAILVACEEARAYVP